MQYDNRVGMYYFYCFFNAVFCLFKHFLYIDNCFKTNTICLCLKTITALSLLCILAACQSDDNSSPQPKPRKDIALTRAEQEMMDLGTDFAFRFF